MSETPSTPKKPPVDWERVELDYRAGIKTLRQIADDHGITHGAVNKRAKAKGWTRDLSAKIAAKIAEKVSRAEVSTEVSKRREVSEREVVEVNATKGAEVLLEHRSDIRRGRTLFQNLMTELEAQVSDPQVFHELGVLLRSENDKGQDKLNDLYHKVISMPGRVDSAKKLVETLEKLVKMEREAFGILPAKDGDDDPMGGGRVITDAERAVRLLHILREGGAG